MTTDLRYPIGRYTYPPSPSSADRERWIQDIAATPMLLREAVKGLSDQQLATPYRPGGWTVRQVVHHVPDSHMNALVRYKLALTENQPTIKAYDEALWAELPDVAAVPIDVSLKLLETLHTRWVALLRAMSPDDYQRTLVHPEHERPLTLDFMLGMYAWHGRHHAAHITSLREREGWT